MKRSYVIAGVIIAGISVVALAVILGIVLTKENEETKTCSVDPFVQSPAPVFVQYGTASILYPEYGNPNLTFTSGDKLEMSCPSGYLITPGGNKNIIETATCVTDNKFNIDGEEVEWEKIYCSRNPYNTAQYSNTSCEANGSEVEIGFQLGDGRFLRTMSVCYDTSLQIAIHSYMEIPSVINQRNLNNTRPSSFLQGSGFYQVGGTMNNLYLRANQRATVNSLIGLDVNSTKYIETNTNFYLARGHLAARSDGFWWAQQNATFYYLNVAPQWHTFNGFNWNYGEIAVRDYAHNNAVDLRVWTGVYGVTTLPHEVTGEDIKLYLYINPNGNHGVPVPELYWKVVYEPIGKRGIALLGINNPYQTNVTKSIICNDISSSVSWLTWTDSLQDGYSYACTIPDFQKVVNGVPNLDVVGLLL